MVGTAGCAVSLTIYMMQRRPWRADAAAQRPYHSYSHSTLIHGQDDLFKNGALYVANADTAGRRAYQ